MKYGRVAFLVILVMVAFVGVFVFAGCRTPTPAPVVAPLALSSSTQARMIKINSASITQATDFIGGYNWASEGFGYADIYYDIDQGSANSITLMLQVSPDNVTWLTHGLSPTIVSQSEADAQAYFGGVSVQLPYFRISATVTNTNVVTPILYVFLR